MRFIGAICLVIVGLGSTSCESLTPSEKDIMQDVEYYGLPEEGDKSTVAAAALNFLPGIGNAYLGQWGTFVANLLFWPFSVAWAVPQAAIDTGTINDKETVEYYRTREGAMKLAIARGDDDKTMAEIYRILKRHEDKKSRAGLE